MESWNKEPRRETTKKLLNEKQTCFPTGGTNLWPLLILCSNKILLLERLSTIPFSCLDLQRRKSILNHGKDGLHLI